MALKDSGGSALGSSRGTGAARSAASYGSGGWGAGGGGSRRPAGPGGAYQEPHLENAYQRGLSDGRSGRAANSPKVADKNPGLPRVEHYDKTNNPGQSARGNQTDLRDWYDAGYADGAATTRGRLKSALNNLVKRKK